MFFKKKPKIETVESLMKDCNKLYSEFIGHFTKAHHKSYIQLKQALYDNFDYIKEKLPTQTQEEVSIALLQHFKQQLIFITKNPFSCDNKEKYQQFISDNFPYKTKTDDIIDFTKGSLVIKDTLKNISNIKLNHVHRAPK